jgi:hypothetical protein
LDTPFFYFLGLRLNELREVELKEIQDLMEGKDLKVILHKTNRSHNYRLSSLGVERLKELKDEVDFFANKKKFQYLFGKHRPPHPKTLLRIMIKSSINYLNTDYEI